MRDQQDTPLKIVAQGLLAGAASTVALTAIILSARRLFPGSAATENAMPDAPALPAGSGITAGEALAEAPDMPPELDRVTAVFAQKVATGLFGDTLSREERYVAGTAWHLAYGGFWGMSYAILEASLDIPQAILAPLQSLFVWAVGPGWLLPRMQLMLPPTEQEPRTLALVLGVHEAWGVLTALILRWLKRQT